VLDSLRNEPKGWLAGGLIGFNRQYGNVVFGVEFNWDAADLTGTRAHVLFPGLTSRTQIDWVSTLAGRLGFTVTERTLIYGKAGFAAVSENHRIAAAAGITTQPAIVRKGWVVGAGLEHMFTGTLSAKVEYNFMDFRSQNYDFLFLNNLQETWRINQQMHVFKAGLNWHFMPTPVIARY
jgi:outer membrane immunogenic protein